MHHVTIAIITLKRPKILALTLQQLANIDLPDNTTVDMHVIDSDSEKSAASIVKHASTFLPFPIYYQFEPKQGSAYARNMALELSTASDYLVCLDDDITVEKRWLVELYNTALTYKAELVVGRLERILPENAPNWAKHCRLFRPKPSQTGEVINMANTGSLLLNRQWVEQHALRFSPDFIQDDTVFSMDAMQQGGTIIFCANAAAKTHIPSERVTLCWALEKCLRNGVTRAAATKRYTMLPVTTAIIVYRACTLFLFAGIALILACMGARPWIRSAEHIAMATGWLIGIVGNKKLLTAPY